MNTRLCVCPFCRALVADDRPPAHYIGDMPTVAQLAELAETRRLLPSNDKRRSRRGPGAAVRTISRHDCPGQCGRKVSRAMLSCRDCWGRVPDHLRHNLVSADNIRRRNPNDPDRVAAHRRAVVACLTWYRDNIRPKESDHDAP